MRFVKHLYLLGLFFVSAAWADPPAQIKNMTWPIDSVQVRIAEQALLFPQEKLYIHTDRTQYVTGERIWFRAYLLDAILHTPSIRDTYVYLELTNPVDSVVARVLISRDADGYNGYLDLSTDLAGGNYILRGYTNRNDQQASTGESFENPVYHRNIRLFSTRKSDEPTQATTPAEFSITFYPEGGQLVEGVKNRVAFKALNPDGSPVAIQGKIVDQDKQEYGALETLHQGMGQFELIPQAGKRYAVLIDDKQFALPTADARAMALRAQMAGGDLQVALLQSPTNTVRPSLYLLLHTRGMVHYMEAWDYEYGGIAFDPADFPSGVLQVLLLDEQANPVSERLVFWQNEQDATLTFTADQADYTHRSRVKASVSLSTASNRNVSRSFSGSFSVAVTDDQDVLPDNNQHLLATMLLGSELRGHILDPAFYLLKDNQQITDVLMMTHGWRRYDIPNVLRSNYAQPPGLGAPGLAITGTVQTTGARQRPMPSVPVSILSWQTDYMDQLLTDSAGRFAFEGIEFKDSLTFVLQATPARGRNNLKLNIDEAHFPPARGLHAALRIPSTHRETPSQVSQQGNLLEKYLQRTSVDIQRGVEIEEVNVESRQRQSMEGFSFYMPRDDRNMLTAEKLEEIQPITMTDALKYIPFITIEDGQVYINQMRSNSLTPVPAVIIVDDIPVSNIDHIDNLMDPANIERIGILKGAGAILLGGHGAGGAVVITTKKGIYSSSLQARQQQNIKMVNPLGLQQPVEFYAPAYESGAQQNSELPDLRTTIYWNPHVTLSPQGEAQFDFYTADKKTSYSVVIEGVTDNGQLIRQVAQIMVK